MDDLHLAIQFATGVNAPKELEKRRLEMQRKLRLDPRVPTPTWTKKEMDEAVQRLVDRITSSPVAWIQPTLG